MVGAGVENACAAAPWDERAQFYASAPGIGQARSVGRRGITSKKPPESPAPGSSVIRRAHGSWPHKFLQAHCLPAPAMRPVCSSPPAFASALSAPLTRRGLPRTSLPRAVVSVRTPHHARIAVRVTAMRDTGGGACARGGADDCGVEQCVTPVRTEADLRMVLDEEAATLYVNRRGRIRSKARLIVLSVTHANSLASGLLRPAFRESCERHRGATRFLELSTGASVEARELARGLGVRKLPYFVLFRDGKRVDHLTGAEARNGLEDWVLDNL